MTDGLSGDNGAGVDASGPTFLASGTIVGGRRVDSVLGSSGTGVVYLATRIDLDQREALKVLTPELRDDAAFRERFGREWQLAASLRHPNILPVFEAGDDDGLAFQSMEYVDGGDLGTEVARNGAMPPARAVAIARQIALALSAAHAAGLVHRDLRPANILLGADDHVFVSGFGLARGASFLGTYEYAAPELLEGRPLDGRTDLYSLGCVLYHCLAGHPPFEAEGEGAVMKAQLLDPPPPLAEAGVPSGLEAVVTRLLAKDPADRFRTAEELVGALDWSASGAAAGAAAVLDGDGVSGNTSGDTVSGDTASSPDEAVATSVPEEVVAAPAAAVAAEPPHRSWNPVDRLTHGMPRSWRVTIDWLVTIVGAILIVLAIKQWVVNPYRIPSSSMEPTLHCARPGNECEAGISDRVLACRFCYHLWSPKRRDIIVFNTPPEAVQDCGSGGVFVKRLIGLPGETWEERNGYVYINGEKLDEPYISANRRDPDTHGPQTIPSGHYFMMGDNRKSSCDSRRWGTVSRGELIGKVVATYWPPNRISIK